MKAKIKRQQRAARLGAQIKSIKIYLNRQISEEQQAGLMSFFREKKPRRELPRMVKHQATCYSHPETIDVLVGVHPSREVLL